MATGKRDSIGVIVEPWVLVREAFAILNARTDLDDSVARHQAKRKLRRALESTTEKP